MSTWKRLASEGSGQAAGNMSYRPSQGPRVAMPCALSRAQLRLIMDLRCHPCQLVSESIFISPACWGNSINLANGFLPPERLAGHLAPSKSFLSHRGLLADCTAKERVCLLASCINAQY